MTCLLLLLASLVMCSSAVAQDVNNTINGTSNSVIQPVTDTLVYIGSSGCETVKRLIGVDYENYDDKNEPDVNNLTLEYRNTQTGVRRVYNINTAAEQIPSAPEWNPNQKLYIFIHGFTGSPDSDSFTYINEALMSKGESNVLALDASSLLRNFYLRATTYVRFIGEKLGQVLVALVNKGLAASAIYIIGHSLGAHIAGFAGKTFTSSTGTKVGRITALDGAGPCYSPLEPALRVNATDAVYVDAIHTDVGGLGIKGPIGHADYNPNGGRLQPGCELKLEACSHKRAWQYYAESVKYPEAFPAVKCNNEIAFKAGLCAGGPISFMGFASAPGTTGTFYLRTAAQSPYGLGMNGIS